MGKHSAPKRTFGASISDFLGSFGRSRQGRHSYLDEEPASAASILRSTNRMPNWAALAVPTAAVASLVVSGVMLAPGDPGTPDHVSFSTEEQPRTGPAFTQPISADNAHADKVRKDWDDAVSRSKETREPEAFAATMKPTTPPVPDTTVPNPGGSGHSGSATPAGGAAGSDNAADTGQSGTCKASFYNTGHTTANGESYNPMGITAAHKQLPFNSKVKVTNKANGQSVVVRINDRGPFVAGRCLDLSEGAMKAVGGTGSGVITVDWEVL